MFITEIKAEQRKRTSLTVKKPCGQVQGYSDRTKSRNSEEALVSVDWSQLFFFAVSRRQVLPGRCIGRQGLL